MANRHLARSVALQSLYAWDFAGKFRNEKFSSADNGRNVSRRRNEVTEGELREIAGHAIEEFGPSLKEDATARRGGADDRREDAFVWQLIKGVIAKQPVLDRVIENAAPEWAIDQITIVDRNILRLGLWELLFGNKEEVPPKVAINEAIELAKSFGAHSSGRFVNGVLGTVYRELHGGGDSRLEEQKDS